MHSKYGHWTIRVRHTLHRGDFVKEGVTVKNIMADGTVCEDLSTYLQTHELPDLAKRLICEFIEDGRELLKNK